MREFRHSSRAAQNYASGRITGLQFHAAREHEASGRITDLANANRLQL